MKHRIPDKFALLFSTNRFSSKLNEHIKLQSYPEGDIFDLLEMLLLFEAVGEGTWFPRVVNPPFCSNFPRVVNPFGEPVLLAMKTG